MQWILDRLKEPSTYAGFATLAAAVGISEPLYAAVSAVVMGIAGVVAVIMAEKAA